MATLAADPSRWTDRRDGLGALMDQFRGRECCIAYAGSSVTVQMDGYRPHMHELLVEGTGRAHQAVHGAIGGVGGVTGVFLMDDLVLRHRPDLCFIEFATGDCQSDTQSARIGPAAEGMIRKLQAIGCRVVLLYSHRRESDADRRLDSVVAIWEEVAAHYRVSSLHLHRLLASRFVEDPAREQQWFKDVVHTIPEGGRFIADAIYGALGSLARDSSRVQNPAPRYPNHFGTTRLIPVTPEAADDPQACSRGSFRFVFSWLSVESGNAFSVESTDEVVGLLVVIESDAGVLEIQTDCGGEKICAFDQWCDYDRLASVIFRTPRPLHEVRVRLTDEAVDHSILRHPIPLEKRFPKRLRAIAWMLRTGGT